MVKPSVHNTPEWLELPPINEKGWFENSTRAQTEQPNRKVATIEDIRALRQRITQIKVDLGTSSEIQTLVDQFFQEFALLPEQQQLVADWVKKQLAQLVDF